MKIGENEYQPPFRELDDEEINEVWVMDAGNNYVKVESVIDALNELAQLRAERDALKARVEELTEVANYAANVCNAATISTSKSEETAYAIGMLERAICRPYQVNASERNTTPGGDE